MKTKTPKFIHLTRSLRPAKTLENIEIMLAAEGVKHYKIPNRCGVFGYSWMITVNGEEHFDDGPVVLAELTSLCRRYDMVSPVVTRADVLALRGRKNAKEGQSND